MAYGDEESYGDGGGNPTDTAIPDPFGFGEKSLQNEFARNERNKDYAQQEWWNQYRRNANPQASAGAPSSAIPMPTTQRRSSGYGGASGGGAAGSNVPLWMRNLNLQMPKAPVLPEYQALEFKPPEEDPNVAKKARAEAAAPGLRAARRQTEEALMGARNMENPNARAQVTRGAIEGYGQSVEGTMAGASAAGRAEAARKRSEQLNIYQSQYGAKSAAQMTNYQNKINTMMADFANAQKTYFSQPTEVILANQANENVKQGIPMSGAGRRQLAAWQAGR